MSFKEGFMKFNLSIFLFIFSTTSFALDSNNVSFLQELLVRAHVTKQLKNKEKQENKIDVYAYCHKVYENSRQVWEKNIDLDGTQLQTEGFIDKKFSLDQILNMKTKHRFLKSNVRGQDQHVNKSSFSSAPIFPHSRPICESYFTEEVSLVQVNDMTCRQIKFSTQDNSDMTYYQVFCENDSNIYINFLPLNDIQKL